MAGLGAPDPNYKIDWETKLPPPGLPPGVPREGFDWVTPTPKHAGVLSHLVQRIRRRDDKPAD